MEPNSPSLASLIGKKISIKIPLWKGDKMLWVKLVGVEAGGIWIESDEFMEECLAETPHKMTSVSIQIFVPYHQIVAIYHTGGGPWISEKVAQ